MALAGAYADYVVCKEEWLARCPVDLLLNVAGGVPLVALTAYQVLSSNILSKHPPQSFMWLVARSCFLNRFHGSKPAC